MIARILEMHNVEAAGMALAIGNYTDAAHVVAASDHCGVADLELDECADFPSVKLILDRVVGTNEGIGVADGAAVVRYNVRDSLAADLELLDFAELVLRTLSWMRLTLASSSLMR